MTAATSTGDTLPPEEHPVWRALASLDASVDAAFEPYRGRPGLEFGTQLLSTLADYGFVWSLIAAVKGRRRGPARRRATRSLALCGIASSGVNSALKSAIGRHRPAGTDTTASDDRPGAATQWVRQPTSTSFPSGHTLAAFCTATVLADTPAEMTAYLGFATAVAASRVYLRAHHPSDVMGGAAIGLSLGMVLRQLVPRREWRLGARG